MLKSFCAGDISSFDVTRLYATDIGDCASPCDDNRLPFSTDGDTSDQPRPSTSRGDTEDGEGSARGAPGRPGSREAAGGRGPSISRRRSSSPAAWPARPPMTTSVNGGSREADSDDADDDDDDAKAVNYSSQGGVESVDRRREDATLAPTGGGRGKQPASKSHRQLAGVNMAAKNRPRQTAAVVTSGSAITSSVTSDSAANSVVATSSH